MEHARARSEDEPEAWIEGTLDAGVPRRGWHIDGGKHRVGSVEREDAAADEPGQIQPDQKNR
jgi:hypothetical protein